MAYKLLIIDDETMLTELLSEHFTDRGYITYVANNSEEAMAKLPVRPDLILLDINMPGMDGLELCEIMRRHIVCPVLFLTARVTEQDKIRGLGSAGTIILRNHSACRSSRRGWRHICGARPETGRRRRFFLPGS